MAAPTTTAHFGMAEEPTAEAAPMPEAGAEAAMAEPEAAMEAPTDDTAAAGPAVSQDQLEADTTETGTTEAADAAESDDDPHRQVVDLGTFESLESLFDNIAARWSAAHQDGTMADSGTCSTAVHEEALELDAEAGQPFIATVGTEDPLRLDARFARRADGTAVIIYATPPSCETETHQQGQSDGS